MGLAPLERQGLPRTRFDRARGGVATGALLELDPDLGGLLDEPRRAAARAELVVRLLRLRRGAWAGEELRSAGADHIGLLVVEGAIAREVVLADTVSTELLGPGDLIRPWSPDLEPRMLASHVRWQVLAEARLAVLSRAFGQAVLRFPEVNAMLLDRLNRRAERLAALKAIAQLNSVERRLLALFWHLADDWGRMTADGVVVPLTLSHRLLGELVGARRPTVSSALAEMARDEKLVRRRDGSWLLAGEPEPTPAAAVSHLVLHRRRLLSVLPSENGAGAHGGPRGR